MVALEELKPGESFDETGAGVMGDPVNVNKHRTHPHDGATRPAMKKMFVVTSHAGRNTCKGRRTCNTRIVGRRPIVWLHSCHTQVRIMGRMVFDRTGVRETIPGRVVVPVVGNVVEFVRDVEDPVAPWRGCIVYRCTVHSPSEPRSAADRVPRTTERAPGISDGVPVRLTAAYQMNICVMTIAARADSARPGLTRVVICSATFPCLPTRCGT